MDTSAYYSTGQMAHLCGTKKATFFHYDELGILKPDYRDPETGFRYYLPESVEVFFAIQALAEAGMSLAQIKTYLEQRSPEGLVRVLEERAQAVSKRIEDLRRIELGIRERIRVTSHDLLFGEVAFEERSGIPLLTTKPAQRTAFSDPRFAGEMAKHINRCHDLGIRGTFSTGGILSREDVLRGNVDAYSRFFTRLLGEDVKFANELMYPGMYAFTFYRGTFEDVDASYQLLIDGAAQSGYEIVGDFYEQTVLDDMSVRGSSEYVYKLFVCVERVQS